MAQVYNLGIASEADYRILQALCIRSMVGDSYKDHLDFLTNERKKLESTGIKVIDVPIDAAEFKIWLKGRIAIPSDLCKFANHTIAQEK